ncbi:MAG: MarR family transcriptional regulator [Acidobacteriaceae bacterium]|jgi:DNA-binding MarR family transcriptional regulator
MKKRTTSEATAQALHSAAIGLLRCVRRADGSSGLNSARLSALSVIVFAGPITLGELAGAEQVRPPTMTRIVNALEEHGLVRKAREERDRRTVSLSATMKGKRLLVESRNRRLRPLADEMRKLGATELKTLQDAAGIVQAMLAEGR